MRKIIPTHVHAAMDYLIAIALLIAPWLSNFHEMDWARTVSLWSGAFVAALAIFTNNEGGVLRVVPMKIHLWIDVLLGVFLIGAPFVFVSVSTVHFFHIMVGFIILGSALFTHLKPIKATPPVDVTKGSEKDRDLSQ